MSVLPAQRGPSEQDPTGPWLTADRVRRLSLVVLPWLGLLCALVTVQVALEGDGPRTAVGAVLLVVVTLVYLRRRAQVPGSNVHR